ncbi:MAG: YicC/YloC family endoribonuclease [Deltaproteobacteria bacterium]
MVQSMTGYGKSESTYGRGRITVEIRSVNHRYGEISVRLPRNLTCFESEIKKAVADLLKRGKIEVFIQHDIEMESSPVTVNLPLARAYHDAFAALKTELGLADEVTLSLIATQRDVLIASDSLLVDEALQDALFAAVGDAVDSIYSMRMREGEALLADLRKRREIVSFVTGKVAMRAPEVVAGYWQKLKERLARFELDSNLDPERLAQEVALMADRSDITEELVRLDSHFKQFDMALSLAEPVGRKLDFLLQEMGREINTIGSKANDAEITYLVVELKTEIEKIREQVQNIE